MKETTPAISLKALLDAFTHRLAEEALAAALELGFEAGPKETVLEALEDELEFWEVVKRMSIMEGPYGLGRQLPTDPAWARICTLEGLATMLDLWEAASGPFHEVIAIVDDWTSTFRGCFPYASKTPPNMDA